MAEWNTPKTDWVINPKNPVAEDFNRIEGNIAFLKQDIETKKGLIVDAINDMNQPAQVTDTHAQLASKIRDISKDATATVGDVEKGKTFYAGGQKRIGTLELTGNATAADVLSGKTFYNTNLKSKVTGTMPNRGAVVITPGTSNKAIQAGYHNGSGYVKGDSNLVPANIVKGKSIFGVAGNAIEVPHFFHPLFSWFGKQLTGRVREISVESNQTVYAPSGKCWIVLNSTYEASLQLITASNSPFPKGLRVLRNEPATVYELDTEGLYITDTGTANIPSGAYLLWYTNVDKITERMSIEGVNRYFYILDTGTSNRGLQPVPPIIINGGVTIVLDRYYNASLIKLPNVNVNVITVTLHLTTAKYTIGTVPSGKLWIVYVRPEQSLAGVRLTKNNDSGYLGTSPVYRTITFYSGQTVYAYSSNSGATAMARIAIYELDL